MPLPAPDIAAIAYAALAGAGGGLLVPRVLSRLPGPETTASAEYPPNSGGANVTARRMGGDEVGETRPAFAELASTRHLAVGAALAAAVCSAIVGWQLGLSPALPGWVYLSVVGVLLGFVDWRTSRLPTAVIAPSYVIVGIWLLVASAVSGAWDNALRALLGWAIAGGSFLVLWLLHPRGLGYGDVRLSGLLGMALGWLGWAELVAGVYAGFCLGAVAGGLLSVLGVLDRRGYPFGPFMLLGALVGLLWGPALARWYGA